MVDMNEFALVGLDSPIHQRFPAGGCRVEGVMRRKYFNRQLVEPRLRRDARALGATAKRPRRDQGHVRLHGEHLVQGKEEHSKAIPKIAQASRSSVPIRETI